MGFPDVPQPSAGVEPLAGERPEPAFGGRSAPRPRLQRIHYDWLDAGENTQRTVARLSQQLRRFLDDQAWLENRRIMDLLHGIETKALALREQAPSGSFMAMAGAAATIELPLERPLFKPPRASAITATTLEEGQAENESAAP
ncbi:MAG: DUF3375 family protein [Desulfurivibrio sp.]|nr:DUF3375 family protein [Desulfurivibrio sp.]